MNTTKESGGTKLFTYLEQIRNSELYDLICNSSGRRIFNISTWRILKNIKMSPIKKNQMGDTLNY